MGRPDERKREIGRTKLLVAFAVVLLTMSVAVSAVSAEGPALFKFGVEEVDLTGIHEGTEEFTFEFGAVKCSVVKYGGGVKSPAKSLAAILLEPTYLECETSAGWEVESKAESCYWLFTSGNLEGGKFEGELHLACEEPEDELTFIVRLAGVTKCTIGIPAQQGAKGITYTNKEANKIKDLTIDINLAGFAYFQTAGTGIGKCTTLAKANGQYSAHPTVTAADKMGAQTHLWIE